MAQAALTRAVEGTQAVQRCSHNRQTLSTGSSRCSRRSETRSSWALRVASPFLAGLSGLACCRCRPSGLRLRRARGNRVACGAGGATVTGPVLVIGGSGRVGGSTAYWLGELAAEEGVPGLEVAVGGRSRERYGDFVERWRQLRGPTCQVPDFVKVDLTDRTSLRQVLRQRKWGLVVHTAGPFQGVAEPVVLQEAVEAGVPYLDVCDDTELCKVAKALSPQAREAGLAAVVSAGIWPGVSALMVVEAVERLQDSVKNVEMSFFTAGTGGAGPTIVSATFLLLAEPPVVFEDGQETRARPWDGRQLADFGPGIGKRYVHLLDEPEVYMCHKALGIPNIRSSFGTDPDIWNWLFAAVRELPTGVLQNRPLMQAVANFSMPVIAAVDRFVGAANGMRIEAEDVSGNKVCLRVCHTDLEQCVGFGTAAFALEVLQGRLPAGVWHPVEMTANRDEVFRRVNRQTLLWDI